MMQAIFIDLVVPGDTYDGKKIIAVEPPTNKCPSWVIQLKGERLPRYFVKDTQILIERGENAD